MDRRGLLLVAGTLAWGAIAYAAVDYARSRPATDEQNVDVAALVPPPALHEVVRLPATDVAGRRWQDPRNRGYLLVLMGECGTCALKHVDVAKIHEAPGRPVVLLYTSRPSEARKAPSGGHIVLSSTDPGIGRQLSSIVVPRMFRLDGSGRMVAYQKMGETFDAFAKS